MDVKENKVQRIYSNKIKCRHCGDVIESTYTHDFRTCKCGKVSVDGGLSYLKRSCEKLDDHFDLSIVAVTD